MSKKSAKGLRDFVFICRSINRAVYTGKKNKSVIGFEQLSCYNVLFHFNKVTPSRCFFSSSYEI
jgi:hypothetical protein